jgi:hypothetical protein
MNSPSIRGQRIVLPQSELEERSGRVSLAQRRSISIGPVNPVGCGAANVGLAQAGERWFSASVLDLFALRLGPGFRENFRLSISRVFGQTHQFRHVVLHSPRVAGIAADSAVR